ncbi:7-carboxy-7-deazaguanine synthase [Parvibium lacunae]|uniref:7-carboxy-7-deazaguanine synthase n=1 Tax=Parvibium lacunae TaxID=1888893 RepID=A0A368L758_9BURK|nr:7-carboxy-7-deazaguanine synthase [Parvibium lacunae]RCS59500.1 7-carboxy-7-deazaguanine synthase [Parvibium lacunae]
MSYSVKEIFYTLQGEGAQAGRPAVFCRFAGCNLWSGREADRASAACQFCDTDFVGTDGTLGGKYATAAALAAEIAGQWPSLTTAPIQRKAPPRKYVVCTGGEPLLQIDTALIEALHAQGFEIAIETNGTLPAPAGIDWICVSPKGNQPLLQPSGHELKVVYPQAETNLDALGQLDFQHFFIQPMAVLGDSSATQANIAAATAYCLAHPQWHLSLQTHKMINIR